METVPEATAIELDDTVAPEGGEPGGEGTEDTLPGEPSPVGEAAPPSPSGRAPVTVLPDVEERDGRWVLVPRERPRYETSRVVGEGGMGVVELARDHDIGRDVAIKRLRASRDAPASLARFVDEVRTIGRLDHPGIAPIHDVGLDADGAFFFVMKYVDGETLEEVIARLREGDPQTHARYGFERRLEIFVAMLHALDYAHSAGLLHRDLKPANVMVGAYGEVLLMDWGIARPIGAEGERAPPEPEQGEAPADGRSRLVSTRAGAVIGTPLYMSPEQARGETDTLDARSDVYAAGMLFLELLTLAHPLEGCGSVGAICAALQDLPPPPVSDPIWERRGQPPVPSELRHFLRRALAPEREERWQSVGEMLRELERIRAGEFRVQCPATFMKRLQGGNLAFIDRHPMLASLLALAVVLTSVGSTGALLYLLIAR